MNNPLQQLRDIHLPAPTSWWPLAPGWYLVVILAGVLMAGLLFLMIKNYRKYHERKFILQQLIALEREYDNEPLRTITELSILLRRIVLAKFSRDRVAGLHGQAWLNFLNETSNSKQFTEGVGQLLISVPYAEKLPSEARDLFPLVKTWVKKQ